MLHTDEGERLTNVRDSEKSGKGLRESGDLSKEENKGFFFFYYESKTESSTVVVRLCKRERDCNLRDKGREESESF